MVDNQDQELPTQDIEAYGHYLKGLELWSIHQTNNPNLRKRALEAEEQLNLTIQKDSSFIDAYVALVDIKTSWMFSVGWYKPTREGDEFAMVEREVMKLKDYAERNFASSWKNILIKAMVAYHGNNNYEEGLKLYEEVLNYDPDNYDAHLGVANIYKRKLMHQEAIEHYSKARKLNPGYAAIWANMGAVFLIMGDYISAEKAAQNAIDLGMLANTLYEFFMPQGKTYPGAKESNPLYYYRLPRARV